LAASPVVVSGSRGRGPDAHRCLAAAVLLAAALCCRFDHPATDCKVMGAEIDRRLARPSTP